MPGVGQAPAPSASVPADRGLGLATPEATAPKSESGTKIRIPGLGIIGEIPKLDLKLELLYGASEPKQQLNGDRDVEASGVMGRVRVPLKSP